MCTELNQGEALMPALYNVETTELLILYNHDIISVEKIGQLIQTLGWSLKNVGIGKVCQFLEKYMNKSGICPDAWIIYREDKNGTLHKSVGRNLYNDAIYVQDNINNLNKRRKLN